jgi:hypothetical protein
MRSVLSEALVYAFFMLFLSGGMQEFRDSPHNLTQYKIFFLLLLLLFSYLKCILCIYIYIEIIFASTAEHTFGSD